MMTKEELKRKYGIGFTTVLDSAGNKIDISERIAKAYSDGATEATKELQQQIEKMKNRKVFLLQRVDSSDNSIDKQFYTTDEEFAKEWDDYHKCNHGKTIELEEF